MGGESKTELDLVKGTVCSMPAGRLAELADDPDVAYITPDRTVRGSLDSAATAVGANIAWSYGYDGRGIGVAVIDSGFSTFTDDLNTWTPSAPGTYGKATSRIVYSKSFI